MVECVKYQTKVRYHSIHHEVYEIFIPIHKIAFHYVNTIIGKFLMVISTNEPRDLNNTPIIIEDDIIDKILSIYKKRVEITKLEDDIRETVEACLYSETVMFNEDPTLEVLKKEVIELTGYSKSQVNIMKLAELKEIVAEYQDS